MSESAVAEAQRQPPSVGLAVMVRSASHITDGPTRDAALLGALRACRHELEAAESKHEATVLRLAAAKDAFDRAAGMLLASDSSTSWTHSSSDREAATTTATAGGFASGSKYGNKRGAGAAFSTSDVDQYGKRSKTSALSSSLENVNQVGHPIDGSDAPATPHVLPTNPIRMPAIHTSAGGASGDNANITAMSEEMVSTHRRNFYQKLLGIPLSEVDTYAPGIGQTNPNLRSKAQLDEAIHIVRHWDTGADGLDPSRFRSRHKKWYTRMKPVTANAGRRTGIHIRTTVPERDGEEGETVLCGYNKGGTDSTVYIDIPRLYDALFEIHCLEHNHRRGKEAGKVRADDLYANVPEQQVKVFVDTCPICSGDNLLTV